MHMLIPNMEAMRAGDLIFFGGVLSWEEDGSLKFPYNVEQQTEAILKRIERYLKTEQLGLEHLVYVTVYLTDIRHYDAMNRAYRRIMKDPLPPRKVITSPLTVTGALVEMTAVASTIVPKVLYLAQ